MNRAVLVLLVSFGLSSTTSPVRAVTKAADSSQPAPGATLRGTPAVSRTASAVEIVKLKQAGIDTTVIRAYIETARAPYKATAEDVLYLHEHQIPDELIVAWMQKGNELIDASVQARAAAAARQNMEAPAASSQPQVVYQTVPVYQSEPLYQSAPVVYTVPVYYYYNQPLYLSGGFYGHRYASYPYRHHYGYYGGWPGHRVHFARHFPRVVHHPHFRGFAHHSGGVHGRLQLHHGGFRHGHHFGAHHLQRGFRPHTVNVGFRGAFQHGGRFIGGGFHGGSGTGRFIGGGFHGGSGSGRFVGGGFFGGSGGGRFVGGGFHRR